MRVCSTKTNGAGRGFLSTRGWKKGEELTDFYGWYGSIYMLMIYGFADSASKHVGDKLVLPVAQSEFRSMHKTIGEAMQQCKQQRDPSSHACTVIVPSCQKKLELLHWPAVNKKVHYQQRLNTATASGLSEMMADCIRVASFFLTADEIDDALEDGFEMHSMELRPQHGVRQPDQRSRGVSWKAQDRGFLKGIAERCRSVQAHVQAVAKLSHATDWLSKALHEAVTAEVDAASRCSTVMAERLNAMHTHAPGAVVPGGNAGGVEGRHSKDALEEEQEERSSGRGGKKKVRKVRKRRGTAEEEL